MNHAENIHAAFSILAVTNAFVITTYWHQQALNFLWVLKGKGKLPLCCTCWDYCFCFALVLFYFAFKGFDK